MRAIAVDDEQIALDNLKITLDDFTELSEVMLFRSPQLALECVRDHEVDVAFLDISMKQMDGLTLAKMLKEIRPNCAVVFLTGYSEYAVQAFQMHASGYLLKPVRRESIRRELDHILNPPTVPVVRYKNIRVQCFGNFEVFFGDGPIRFQYNKTKELLAYLVDRKGTFCSNGELVGILWEERDNSPVLFSQLRNLLADLLSVFRSAGNAEAIIKRRGMTAIVPDKLDCDYYDWLKGKAWAINAYTGEYMSQYSWGELTLGALMRKP